MRTKSCMHCNENFKRAERLEAQNEALWLGEIGNSAIRFVASKGLSEEWARFLLEESYKKAGIQP